jgi:phthiodiolone/phenolphthiodiolone dimycocerosates ketoreductase
MSPSSYGQCRDTIAGHADRSGRPMPECAMQVNVVAGENRDHVAELMEQDPLGKLVALMCPADTWAKYGLRHPSGQDCRGLVDLVFHDLDPDELREMAPRIPVELVEELMFLGNATEIVERVNAYAANGLGHAIVASVTGVVGGVDEITANTDELIALFDALHELTPAGSG